MTRYEVVLTHSARSSIRTLAAYMASEAQSHATAQGWLEQVWDAIDSLERWPGRGSIAEEARFMDVEVRRLLVGEYLLLFKIDERRHRILIIELRSGHRRPRGRRSEAEE